MDKLFKNEKIKKILIGLIGILVLILLVFVFSKTKKSNEIPFDVLIETVEKEGENLSWNSFKKYKSEKSEDGLVYLTYDVEGNYSFVISGKSMDNSPWAFTLINTETYAQIDVLSQDIITFLGDDY